ncbi:hypothetical protein Rsub_06434 [Raphidocelis subcapitata]|uniref:Carbohydrate kinase PfkB domain-containing protein n=1 Tax=Raphidocelis subcapitata TaxID=307507 RepID=A0A2V0P0J8_9CHLO|nr:hypothetical protein Rsub_06434 [Raphidocelis subcapitata]|eukprot:GBF93396.1 hypothetical protein Rsub_06434 [Raphidocelis subcapitata]
MSLVVIGGAVLDVQAHPAPGCDVRRGGSVPGEVRQVPGGVGRNIAEAASHLWEGGPGRRRSSGAEASTSGGGGGGPAWSGGGAPARGGGGGGGGGGVLLITVLGTDAAGDALAAHCASLGLPASGLARVPGAATPSVSIVFDAAGEVAASVADAAALEAHLTPAALRAHAASVARAAMVVIDGNLSEAAAAEAARMASEAGAAVLFEPISVPKSVRCVPVLASIDYITPNAEELRAIASALQPTGGFGAGFGGGAAASPEARSGSGRVGGVGSSSRSSGGGGGGGPAPDAAARRLSELAPAAAAVLAAGTGCIVLTMGELGAALLTLERGGSGGGGGDGGGGSRVTGGGGGGGGGGAGAGPAVLVARHMPAAPARVVSVSGAGDCLAAGFASALAAGETRERALARGLLAARAAVECAGNVPPRGALRGAAGDEAAVAGALGALRVLRFPLRAAL